jgi:large subunit ribosomal protein L15
VPKHGFSNAPFRTEYDVANVQRLQHLVDEGRLSAGDAVTPAVLADLGLVQNEDSVKVLGDGSISTSLDVSAHAFSASAREKIEAAGGTATALDK